MPGSRCSRRRCAENRCRMDPHADKSRLVRLLGRPGRRDWGMDAGAYDPAAVTRTLSRIRWLFGEHAYFPVSIWGLENLPAAPLMLVMNHSGGTTTPDVWGFCSAWYAHFGVERPIHPLAHEIILATEHTERFFAKRGVLHASRRVAADVLGRFRHDLLIMPGGDLDTWRPFRDRW